MNKFRKKPVVIEAYQYTNGAAVWEGSTEQWPEWLFNSVSDGVVFVDYEAGEPVTKIKTLEGNHTVSARDWIIRGVAGELYPCKPDIFAATYEAVE